jgi:uncharacterized membrane protein
MTEYLGAIASFLFIKGSAMQAIKCFREGHARGISHGLIWPLLLGFAFMSAHVLNKVGWDLALMSSYVLQTTFILVTAKYKIWERK